MINNFIKSIQSPSIKEHFYVYVFKTVKVCLRGVDNVSTHYLVRRCLLPPVLLEALPVAVAAAGGLAAHDVVRDDEPLGVARHPLALLPGHQSAVPLHLALVDAVEPDQSELSTAAS